MLEIINTAKDKLFPPPKLPDISLISLTSVLRSSHHEGFMVSGTCVQGGGYIIPIGSSNLDNHLDSIREHLDHGDPITLSIWSEKPVMMGNDVLAMTPKRTSEYNLVAS